MKQFFKRYVEKLLGGEQHHIPARNIIRSDLINLAFDTTAGRQITTAQLVDLYTTTREEAQLNLKIATALDAVAPRVFGLRGDEMPEQITQRFAQLTGQEGSLLERKFLNRILHPQMIKSLLNEARAGRIVEAFDVGLSSRGPFVSMHFDTGALDKPKKNSPATVPAP